MAKMASLAAEMEDLPDEYLEQIEEAETSPIETKPVVAKTHKVVDGDSYASIAAKYCGKAKKHEFAKDLVAKNSGKTLVPGMVVIL